MLPQNNPARIPIAIIPAPDRVPGKTPHRCFWHDDQHPSAVTFFHEDGRCLTFCSAERRKEWGTYEIRGGDAVIYPLGPRRLARAPIRQSREEGEAERMFIRFCYSVLRKEQPRPISSLREGDFWYVFLQSKRVDVSRAAKVENPPVWISVGILFPAYIFRMGQPVQHEWQLRTVGIKAISLWKASGERHYYLPNPSLVSRCSRFFVVESPFVALRLAYLGLPAVATFGKLERFDEISRLFAPALPIVVGDEPGKGHITQDFDMLSDEAIIDTLRLFKDNGEAKKGAQWA